MIKKIKKPWFYQLGQVVSSDAIDKWFDENIEPINKALDSAVEVYSSNDVDWTTFQEVDGGQTPDTHKALLINIEPIEQDTAEKILKDLIMAGIFLDSDVQTENWIEKCIKLADRAKKVLNKFKESGE